MKQTIRLNTFETNSSSTHSMIIMNEEEYNKFQDKPWYNVQDFYKYDNGNFNYYFEEGKQLATQEEIEALDVYKNFEFNEDEAEYDNKFEAFCSEYEIYDWKESDYLEYDDTTYTTKSREKLYITCKYGRDG